MSLVKNLKRREVEIFGAKRVVRNDIKEKENKKEQERIKGKKNKNKTEVK